MGLVKIIRLDESRSSINNKSEQDQIAAIYNDWTKIASIKSPTEAVQLAAVKRNLTAIRDIKNPTEAVQLFVIGYSAGYVTDIEHPTQNAVRLALKNRQFIVHEPHAYERFVKIHFANNILLMKKWLRYGEVMRNQE